MSSNYVNTKVSAIKKKSDPMLYMLSVSNNLEILAYMYHNADCVASFLIPAPLFKNGMTLFSGNSKKIV